MPATDSSQFLLEIKLNREKIDSFDIYPFNIPCIYSLETLKFHSKVTFIVGENGSGKSTLLEGIAVALRFNAEGGSKNFRFSTHSSHSELSQYLRMVRGTRMAKDGYFLRAESFFNVATEIENLGIMGYGDKSPHEQSHGESFLSLLTERFRGEGLYLLDEPEAALSPVRQMSALVRIHQLVAQGSQFIIATHSPILMAYPDAQILLLSEAGISPIRYEETEHFSITRRFLNDHSRFIQQLLAEDKFWPNASGG